MAVAGFSFDLESPPSPVLLLSLLLMLDEEEEPFPPLPLLPAIVPSFSRTLTSALIAYVRAKTNGDGSAYREFAL